MSEDIRKLSFEEIEKIDLEQLLANRPLQRYIHYSISGAERKKEYETEGRPFNPHPVVALEGPSGASPFVYNTFRINDDSHLYFFSEGLPIAEIPDFLRPEDIILSGIGDIPFNKPICRVGDGGGLPERYNSRIGNWEQYGDQKYQPEKRTVEDTDPLGIIGTVVGFLLEIFND